MEAAMWESNTISSLRWEYSISPLIVAQMISSMDENRWASGMHGHEVGENATATAATSNRLLRLMS